ncbi:ATP-binding protein [Algibacter sp. AS12]|uniref:hybrid sensor histidine kinase/response regulator transcription factor n=1 Tax=Algibacter sp. AS12 TaxID=3135773 RepID=UPI00398B15AA
MSKKIIYIIALMLSFLSFEMSSQSKTLEPKQNLTISDGLAHNGVTTILEDSNGFLWIGTYDGLNRYDGYELKTYKNTLDKDILVSNRIRNLIEDDKNNIWIGTDEGISTYNYLKEEYHNVYTNKNNNKGERGPVVRDINLNKGSGLIVCSTESEGVLVFKSDQTLLGQYIPNPNEFGKDVLFYKSVQLDNDFYIFSSSVGILIFNVRTGQFNSVLDSRVSESTSILKIDGSKLLVTLTNGIAICDFTKKNGVYAFNLTRETLKSYQFNTSLIDDLGNLWLGTLNDGLIHLENIKTQDFKNPLKILSYKPNTGILRSSCFSIATNGSCWYGTFNEGVFKFDIKENPFNSYGVEMENDFGLQTNHIGYISAIDSDKVYLANRIFGSNNGGLDLFNTKTKSFEKLPFNISNLDVENVGAVYADSRKNVWIKIENKGLFRVREGLKNLEKITNNKISDFDKIKPRSFTEDNDGNIWIGCLDDIYKITIDRNNEVDYIENLNSNPFFKTNNLSLVRYVYKDPIYDFIWLGADSDGLFRVDIKNKGSVKDYKVNQFVNDKNNKRSISSNFVTSVIRLPNDELWIGTEGGGICKVVKSDTEPEFISFSEKHGLSNNVVKSIMYDDENNLWVATNVGLNKFNTIEQRFRRFGVSDGLPFEDFWFSSEKLDNGYFLFSGLDGFCYFNPKALQSSEDLPRLEFDDLKVFNKSILPGDKLGNRVLFNRRLKNQDELILNYDENVFSIKLTSLHFSNPDNHNLKYRLLPVSEDWVEIPSSQQTIYYNGLQPGEYNLEVMASNALDDWTAPQKLKITITPPFWRTMKAYLLYALLSVLIIYLGVKIVLRIQKLNHNLEIEQLEKDKVKEINQAKLRFFSNISHELKTPLTLISGPINALFNQFKNNEEIKGKLQIVERQSNKISHLVNQVHDFQKAEANALKMNYSRFSFNAFIKELITDFSFMAENDQKKLVFEDSDANIIVSADRDKLEKVFYNILSNSFKYTKPNDTIKVDFESEEKDLIVSITDTGKGIDKADLAHVFERFYQSHNHQDIHSSGSGIGLSFTKLLVEMHYGYINAESELGKGTTINIRLPIVKKETAKDQEKVEKDILSAEAGFKFSSQLIASNNPKEIIADGSFSEALIFYVEDNLDMRMFVSNSLTKFFKLKTFSDGQECLDAMEDEWPDLVISDVHMPQLNGLDLCRAIKSDIKTSHIPVILLTALTNVEDKIQGIRDGADAYIQKPFNVQHLITRTESLLRNRQQLRERFQIGIPLTKENNLNNRNDNAFLEKLYNLIEENLDNQNLDLNSFTKELYLNRTHFYQKVKALTNLTPFEVLKDYRLKKAAEFLVHKRVSVNEVYAMTGFKSRTHFSKLFKERYNITPGKYAAETRKKYTSE